jgi:outer membrane protein TolC
MTRSQIEQEEVDYRHELYTLIERFSNQRQQCAVARRAKEIADDRYQIAMENFRQGKISVTEMNTAQSEKDSANQSYVSEMAAYWQAYYELRGKALYDFITGTDIVAEFDKIIEQ